MTNLQNRVNLDKIIGFHWGDLGHKTKKSAAQINPNPRWMDIYSYNNR